METTEIQMDPGREHGDRGSDERMETKHGDDRDMHRSKEREWRQRIVTREWR
jgi:hypothetical protein